jgi:hypothetical protein
VAGRRAGRAAHGGDQIIVVAALGHLGAFGREALDVPVLRIAPGIIDVLGLADRRQAVGRQLDAVAARQEQPAHAVLVDHVAGIDVAGQL